MAAAAVLLQGNEAVAEGAIAAGIDVFYPADDFAYNKGLFVEPRRFARLWRPHY